MYCRGWLQDAVGGRRPTGERHGRTGSPAYAYARPVRGPDGGVRRRGGARRDTDRGTAVVACGPRSGGRQRGVAPPGGVRGFPTRESSVDQGGVRVRPARLSAITGPTDGERSGGGRQGDRACADGVLRAGGLGRSVGHARVDTPRAEPWSHGGRDAADDAR